jgi:outer membrane protein
MTIPARLVSPIVLLTCALLWALGAQAQDLRVGFVDTDRILKEAGTAKAAQSRLEQEFSKREKDLADGAVALKTAADKFDREAPTLADGVRLIRQKQLIDQDRELQRKRREFQDDLNARKNEELQQVLERANKAVKQIAVSEKYDLIFQDAVYVNPKLDITDKVLKALSGTAPALR